MEKEYPQRTLRQNRALHKYFTHISDELNDHGLNIMKTLRSDAEIPWSPELVKALIWKPIMKAQTGKDSTTKLNTKDIDAVLDTLTKYMGEKLGLTVEFPSIETVIREQQAKEQV